MPPPTLIRCPHCGKDNVGINIICSEDCSRPLIRIRWWYLAIFCLTIFVVGYVIAHTNANYFAPAYSLLLLSFYVGIIFRGNKLSLQSAFFLMLLAFPAVFLLFQLSNRNWFILDLVSVCAGGFLLAGFIFAWMNVCALKRVSWLKGFPVITFVLFLTSVAIETANESVEFLNSRLSSLIISQIRLRTILLILTIAQISLVALYNSAKNKIAKPKDLFLPVTNVVPWRKRSSLKPVISAILQIVGSAVNFFLLLYKHSTQLLKTILNTVKRWLEYFVKFLINFVSEMLVLLRTFITVLLSSLVKFGRRVVAPLLSSYGIALISLMVVDDIRQNILIQDATVYAFLQHLAWPLLHCLLLFLATIVFVWAVSNHQFAETINSVGVSNVYVVFTLVITTLISSGFLWVLAQFLESSPFKSFGYFTAIGAIGIAVILFGLFIWQNVIRRGATTVP